MEAVIAFFICCTIYEVYNRYATHKERMNGLIKKSDDYLFSTIYKTTESSEQEKG